MRIDLQSNPQPLPETNRSSAPSSPATNSSAPRTAAAEDQAELSGACVQVQALAAQVSQLPEIRQERVQRLCQAVESGSYTADARAVAGAMLAQMISRSAA